MNINTISNSKPWLNDWREVTPGEKFTIRTSIEDTGGIYTALEMTVEPRNGVPVHTHANEEEHFIVLEGSLHLMNGSETVILAAGDSATVKRGTHHAWANLSDTMVRMVTVLSPGQMEKTFRMIGAMEGGDLAAIAESAKNGGSTIIGPPPFENVYSVMSPRPKS